MNHKRETLFSLRGVAQAKLALKTVSIDEFAHQ